MYVHPERRDMKTALYQMHIEWEDKETNLRKLESGLLQAASEGAELLLLPEMSFTGFSMNTEATGEKDQTTSQRVRELARRYGIAVGFGWVKDCGEKCENHYTVLDREGNVLSDYAKIHPFSYSGEDLKFRGGNEISRFSVQGIPCSNFICYDLRFPEIFQKASKDAHVIFVPADWPASRSAHWKTLLAARAIENQVYILGINCVGDIGGLYYSGDSCIVTPDGRVEQMLSDREGILFYDLYDDVCDYRKRFPVKQDRRESLYRQPDES